MRDLYGDRTSSVRGPFGTKNSNKDLKQGNPRLHRIETEEDPEILFQQLIKASPNGEVPDHLIKRLKEMEERKENDINNEFPTIPRNVSRNQSKSFSKKQSKKNLEEELLYASFIQSLLEEDPD